MTTLGYVGLIKNILLRLISPVSFYFLKCSYWNSLVVQWLGLHTFTAKDAGSIPGWGTKIPQAKK